MSTRSTGSWSPVGSTWPTSPVLRSYRRYRRQVVSRYSVERFNDVLVDNPDAVRAVLEWFRLRFDPEADEVAEASGTCRGYAACDRVTSLDADRILRGLIGTVDATVRTNRYLRPEGPIALKFDERGRARHDPTGAVPRGVRGRHADRGHPRALRARRPGRDPLQRPTRRLPQRGHRPGAHPGAEERAHRPHGLQGWVRRATRAKAGVAGGPLVVARTAYESFITGLLDITDRPRRRRGRVGTPAATATTPTWWSRPTRAPRRSPTWPTGWPRHGASGSATRSPRVVRTATTTRPSA